MPVRLANQTEPIPGYRLIERLGRGGFGEVWKAEAPGGLHKAIKFVFGELDAAASKSSAADQEFKALNRVKTVRHPFILSLERVDIVEGQLVIVMELADRNLLERHKECLAQHLPGIPREELLRYMEEAAEALDLMNVEYQLQHLDIKPQNLFLVRNHIKVADFGLVKDMEGMTASVTGGVTPVYAAPETFEGRVSRFCDQYSLAVVYEELLTGQRPFDGTNARHLLMQHTSMPPDLNPLPPGDRAIVGRALAKKPDDRFPTCAEFVAALRAASPAAPPPTARTPESPPPAGSTPRAPAAGSSSDGTITRNLRTPQASPAEILVTPRPGPSNVTKTPTPRPDIEEGPVPSVTETSTTALHISAPVEFRGAGVLVPALVVGLGQTGLAVLQRLRESITDRYGPMAQLPHLRLLYIDTDPDGIGTALRGASSGVALEPHEVLLTRLQRPSHYLKPREAHTSGGVPPITTWLDPKMLYRIPRSQMTANVRALGRLALVDNYRDVADRLRAALGGCTEAEALATADRNTRLGLRVNRPRVYVATSLSGGTGSGMFIDVAYIARHFLRQLGFPSTDIIGLFFVPPADKQTALTRSIGLGNTCASLIELNHFSTPGVTFGARYEAKEPLLLDSESPFTRCLLLPESDDEANRDQPAGLGASFLVRDLMTPLGRAADTRRASRSATKSGNQPPTSKAPTLHTFGMYRLSWPRRVLVERAARRLGQRLLDHWLTKDSTPLRSELQTWAKTQFTKRTLEPENLIRALRGASESILDQEPEDAFDALVERAGKPGTIPDPRVIAQVLEQLEQVVGRPEDKAPLPQRPALVDGLDDAARNLLQECEQKIAEAIVSMVEQPKYRFAGAEESVRQVSALLQDIINRQEPLADDFLNKSNTAYGRIMALNESLKVALASRRKPPDDAIHLPSLLRLYPRARLQALILQRVLTVYRSLQNNCPEYQREFTYCRTRLAELQKAFAKPAMTTPTTSTDLGPGRHLLPAGCKTLDDAVSQLLQNVTAAEVVTVDHHIQESVVKEHFQALVHICTTPANNILREVELAVQKELETAVQQRLGTSNVLDTFLGQAHREAGAVAEIGNAFDQAAPTMPAGARMDEEIAVVVVPGEPAADQFRKLAVKAVPTADVVIGNKGDDVVFYREQALVSLEGVPQVGVEARAAYEKMSASEHLTPHNRTDITEWTSMTGG